MEHTPQSLLNRLAVDPRDPDAWGRLDRIYAPFLRTLLSRFVPAQDVDDLLQKVRVVLLRKLGTFAHNQNPGAFRCWLRTVVARTVSDHRRARRAELPDDQLDALGAENSELGRRIDREHAEYALRELCAAAAAVFPDKWPVFRAYALDGRPADEVAAEYGVEVGEVYKVKSVVLAWLRAEGRGLIDE